MRQKQGNNLFLHSGCLTQEAIRFYNNSTLTGEELMEVRQHMEECPLCSDAAEGLKLVPGHKEQKESVQDIRKGLFRRLEERSESSRRHLKIAKTYRYVAAAASVILIVGIFSIYHFLLRQDNNMIADNIEAEKAIPETISEKQLQPGREKEIITPAVTPVQQPKRKGRRIDTKKSEIVTIDKQEEIKEPEVLAEEVKLDMKEKISRQVSAIRISGTESDDTGKGDGLTDEVHLYEISGVEAPEETRQKKSAVAGVARGTTESASEKRTIPKAANNGDSTEPQPQFEVEGYEDFDDYIMQNIQYPESAIKEGTEGIVWVEFNINKRGKVTDVKVVESIDERLDNEAVRVVSSSPRWIAAEMNGKKTAKKMTVTVEFHLK
ncbi:MAG: TonB family protein [Bacteroidetes bacterium]|nr:TonB family protein [Bacteroidota bacterium]